jgi:hypothetical protein
MNPSWGSHFVDIAYIVIHFLKENGLQIHTSRLQCYIFKKKKKKPHSADFFLFKSLENVG